MQTITSGQKFRFEYPEEFTTSDEHSAHRGQTVTVLRACTEAEAGVITDDPDNIGEEQIVDRMFKIQAIDGWVGFAWQSELVAA